MKIKDFVLLCSTIGIATAVQTIDRQCLDCMCQASSSCNLNLRCHNAADGSYYCGPYQISWAYWADAGKPGSAGFSNDFEKCLVDRSCAEKTIAGYMSKWASDCNGDGQIDCLDFAAIHKTGPTAQCNQSWLKKSKYWTDFNRCYAAPSHSTPVGSNGDSSSGGITGSTHFPSNNPNREVAELNVESPRLTGAYAISSSDPRPISRSTPEVTDSASSSQFLPVPSSTSFSSSSSSYPSSSSHYSSSSSSYSNYTEITEESSSGNTGNIDASYNPPRSPLPGSTVYESLSNNGNIQPNTRTSVVEEVTYESPSVSAPAPQPTPTPIRVDVRPISNDYGERENAPLRTASNYHSSTPTNSFVHERPAPVAQPVLPVSQPIAPVNSVTSYVSSSALSTVSDSCMQCLCQASSKCQLNKGCDGAYCGPYLLSWAYWTDGGKPGSSQGLDYPTCSSNHSCAEQAVNGYMTKWTRDCNGDGVVDCIDFALIHKLGPHGCGRLEALKSTEYWNRFEACHGVSNISPAIESESPAVQPTIPEVRREVIPETAPETVPYQPEIRHSHETSNYSPPRSSRVVEVEPTARRNDFHEQPLNVPRPQPNAFFTPRSSSSGSTSNIRISFNNRDVVNTALQDTPIIHTPQPAAQPARQPVNNFNNRFTSQPSLNSFNPRAQEYPPLRPQSAFASETVSERPYARDYNSNSNSGSNIREVPANNDNTGFGDENSFSGRSVDGNIEEISPSSEDNYRSVSPSGVTGFNPFEPLNNTGSDIVSQECLNCMCHAASRCDANIGCSSDSSGKFVCGVFQVDWEYWSDAGKPGNRADLSNLENFQMCLNNRKCADDTIRGYMKTHKMDCNGDGKIDCHDFAALHVVGPKNCRAKWYLDSKYHSDFNECISF